VPNPATPSTNSRPGAPPEAEAPLGSTLPRLITPPLVTGPAGGCPCGCALTERTSYGFDVIDFARNVCGTPLDPWQELAAIHLGELLPDGRPRFRTVLILVARQNGKTLLAKILVLFWQFIEALPLTLITSTDRSYAKRTWTQIHEQARGNEWLAADLGPDPLRLTPSEESFQTAAGAEFVFRANNGRAGRSMTLWRWLCDELREHKTRDAWDSATNAMNAVPFGQVVCISNQGGADSVVLDSLRDPAVSYIETGEGDPRLGLLEWSAPDGAEPDDLDALAQANPNMGRLGHGPDPDALLSAARRAKRAGGLELSGFTTEVMCRRVDLLDPAIDPHVWAAARAGAVLDLAQHRDRVALALDVSLAADHAALIAAAEVDGVVYLDVVKAWDGPGCTAELRRELPGIVAKVSPRALGWLPNGPAAVVAAEMIERKTANWPPRRAGGRRVQLVALTTDAPTAAMSFAELVKTGEVAHQDDPMLTAHIGNAQRLRMGDRWTFGRRGAGPVNGAYAAAAAVWLARTLPPPPPPLSVA
jgi:hypothetical protein